MKTTNEKVNKMNDKDKADSIAESIEHEVGNLFIDNGFPIFDAYSHRIHPRRIIRKELKEKKEVTVP
jgi:hypothetical protein